MRHACPLCSYRIGDGEVVAAGCGACASSPRSCGLARCPACGYEWPAESDSRLVRLLRRLLGAREAEGDDT